jgi:acetolactate synthase-1/2/3 large subunit
MVATTTRAYPDKVQLKGYNPTYSGHLGQVKKAAEEIMRSKRPVLYTGGGIIISDCYKELLKLAELTQTPVTNTLLGLGGFPGTHKLFMGMLGMHGTWYANNAITDSDLIIAIGARFDDRVTGKISEFAPNARIIHIDIDPSSISKNVKVDLTIVGDAKDVLSKLIKEVKGLKAEGKKPQTKKWLAQIDEWKKEHPLKYNTKSAKIKPQFVVEEIYRITKGEAIITTEVGQNQMWAAQFYNFANPRSFLSSGGLGTMGYGFPAAIGAQMGNPDRIVIDIAGDGSFQMNLQELATVVQYRLPVKVAILNNRFLGMVRQWQQLFYDKRYSSTCIHCAPDFVKLAEAFGAVGLRAEKPEEVAPVIEQALAINKPVVMDFRVDPEENVAPMVPAGGALKDMILV